MNTNLDWSSLDWKGLIINLVSLFTGFFVYLGIYNSRLAEKLDKYKYPILLATILFSCLTAWILRFIFGF